MCLLINDNGCTDGRIVSQGTTVNLEFITIKCRPVHFPRDLSSVTITAVYIKHSVERNAAVEDIQKPISKCDIDDPNTLSIVAGDLSQANLKGTMPVHRKYATRPSRDNRILDHCYCKEKKDYKSVLRIIIIISIIMLRW